VVRGIDRGGGGIDRGWGGHERSGGESEGTVRRAAVRKRGPGSVSLS